MKAHNRTKEEMAMGGKAERSPYMQLHHEMDHVEVVACEASCFNLNI